MAGGGWSPIENGPARVRKKRRVPAMLIAAVAVACLVSVAVVRLRGGIDGGTDGDPAADAPAADHLARDEAVAADMLLDLAADRLVDEGSYSFDGRTSTEGHAAERSGVPTIWGTTSSGRADSALLYTETTERTDGTAYETILDLDGGLAWWRVSAFADRLGARPWVRGDTADREVPAPLRDVRNWLEDATDARDSGEDENGRAVVEATLPTPLLDDLYGFVDGVGESFVSAQLTVTVADTGLPVRVEVAAAATEFDLELDYRLHDFGSPVDVVLPSGAALDATPTFREEDIAELHGRTPLGLGRVPGGWALRAAHVRPDENPDCTALVLDYGPPGDPGTAFLVMSITSPDCVHAPSGARSFAAGSHAGLVADVPDGLSGAFLDASGVTFHTTLSAGDLSLVLASLGPLDLTAPPAPIDGLPSAPA